MITQKWFRDRDLLFQNIFLSNEKDQFEEENLSIHRSQKLALDLFYLS
jgi:hypothetical protein